MTNPTQRKWRQRLGVIGAHTIRNLTVPFLNLLLSLLVIKLAGAEVWGVFVEPMILVTLAAHLVHWGSRDFLLRRFSRSPATILTEWQSSLSSRLVATPLLILGLWAFFHSWAIMIPLTVWLVALVINQSMEVLVVYQRKFGIAVIGEVLFFGVAAGGLLLDSHAFRFSNMIGWWALGQGLKATYLSMRFYSDTWHRFTWRWSRAHWSQAWPFFLVRFVSLLQSRIDLYLVAFFLQPASVAHYQVLIGLLLYVQAMSGFTLIPYVKVLYRLRNKQFRTIQRSLSLIGIGAAGLGVPLVLGILWWLYGFTPEWSHLIWGILYVWPMYVYTTAIYHNYKHHRERSLLSVYVAGTLLNAGLNIWLLPQYEITGALAASAAAQWLMMGWLVWLQRRIRVK